MGPAPAHSWAGAFRLQCNPVYVPFAASEMNFVIHQYQREMILMGDQKGLEKEW
jgi:hypothetical protein